MLTKLMFIHKMDVCYNFLSPSLNTLFLADVHINKIIRNFIIFIIFGSLLPEESFFNETKYISLSYPGTELGSSISVRYNIDGTYLFTTYYRT